MFSITPLSFDAPSPGNPREYPHKPYITRNYSHLLHFLSDSVGLSSFKFKLLNAVIDISHFVCFSPTVNAPTQESKNSPKCHRAAASCCRGDVDGIITDTFVLVFMTAWMRTSMTTEKPGDDNTSLRLFFNSPIITETIDRL